MASTGQALIDEVAELLRDPSKRQWSQDRLVSALASAYQALCTYKPDAHTIAKDVTLEPGTEQSAPDGTHSIMEIIANVCSVGGTEMRAITKSDKSAMDAACPHWRSDSAKGYIKQWMNSQGDDRRFFVWPQAGNGNVVRMILATVPVVDDVAADISVDSIYYPFLREWMLYYSYQVDDEMTANADRAARHYRTALELLGIRSSAQRAVKVVEAKQE